MPSTGRLKAFKLLSDVERLLEGRRAATQPMQRIYGTAFLSEADLKAHLQRIEEAKKRDHRKVGKRAGPVHVPPVGARRDVLAEQGHDALQHARRTTCGSVLFPAGYVEVKTPLVFNKALWETSGHWQHYRENMFLIESEGEQMGMKAMNCPGHMLDVRAVRCAATATCRSGFTSRRRCTATKRLACSQG